MSPVSFNDTGILRILTNPCCRKSRMLYIQITRKPNKIGEVLRRRYFFIVRRIDINGKFCFFAESNIHFGPYIVFLKIAFDHHPLITLVTTGNKIFHSRSSTTCTDINVLENAGFQCTCLIIFRVSSK